MSEDERKLFGIAKLNIPRSDIPAVTHVDYSARIQTVHRETNPRYHALISAFEQRTGCPVIVNTSFNVRGEPIVCTPEDAFHCFMGTEIETLAIGNCFLRKEDQDAGLKQNYETAFDLDYGPSRSIRSAQRVPARPPGCSANAQATSTARASRYTVARAQFPRPPASLVFPSRYY